MIAFGPVPSRRLGFSIGINNIPPKICTYTCVYCQLGKAVKIQSKRESFYATEAVIEAARRQIEKTREHSPIDYLTVVPDGEPTLDINLGKTIHELRKLGYPVAVITNSSLLWDPQVRKDLMEADWVSTKLDAGYEKTWRKVDAPHPGLSFKEMVKGLQAFSEKFKGIHATETMLIKGYNDGSDDLKAIADILKTLQVDIAYISIPTRPPAAKKIKPADESSLLEAWKLFSEVVPKAEHLIGYEGNAFASTGNIEEDLLSITAVHPMREEAIDAFLKKNGGDWDQVEKLVNQQKLKITEFDNHFFYSRKFS